MHLSDGVLPMILIPYQADVPMSRWPLSNFAIIAATCLVFVLLIANEPGYDDIESFVAYRWNVPGMFAHIFLHGGWIHLIGNMVFLWVFDILGAALGSGGVAYWAHLGGFAAGVGLGCALLSLGWIEMDRAEQSLYDVFAGRT